ncbi:uncharacterized protein N7484_004429 [Penicillium longicatenatum]|uniref:uncharacterized protein n=1 Tax=Penicillium longicatenatum TaxID=1561947 RepID=UPI0025474FA7|nr:uncharacterized protein N7484_004429 [Penicillium longicatenatum]KAJ5650706.1 hypothetical protein N7484_004429 [Penicillium longicatenatum]
MKVFSTPLFVSLLYNANQIAASACTPDAFPSINSSAFKIAAVREPPVNFALPIGLNKTWVNLDLNATIDQAIGIIEEAQIDGVSLLAFPELYFPGYPVAINTAYTTENIAQYVAESMSVNSPNFHRLADAFQRASMYGSFGFSEIADDAIYMAQALIGPDGSTLIHRRKLRPSGTERDIWSDGDPSGLVVKATPHGRIGMLECWEHFHPTMTFPMLAQLENIHIAAFPYAYDFGIDPLAWESAEVGVSAARWYSTNMGGTVIMPAVGTAVIFVDGGATANISNSTANPSWRYVSATIDTTSFSNATFDLDGEHSWGALKQIIETYPSYILQVDSTFFKKETHPIKNITS